MFSFLSKIRVLPLTIFAATLMLSVKIGAIVDGVVDGDQPIQINQAKAQVPPPPPGLPAAPPLPAPPDGLEPAPPLNEPAAPVDDLPEREDPTDDPTLFTQTEIDLLQQLADRREALERQEEEMNLREAMLKAAEDRINKKIEEMRVLEKTIQALVKTHDEQEEQKVRSLVQIYENMKPKDAARIFEELDLDTLLLVAERMKERKLAPVMAQMNPERAKEMTVELSRLRELPTPGSDTGS